jgi:WD40 repeat protein
MRVVSRDGRKLASLGDNSVEVWDVVKDARITAVSLVEGKLNPERPAESWETVEFDPDGTRVVVKSGRVLAIFDAGNGRQIAAISGHTDDINAIAFSPDNSRVATASKDGTARIWRVADGKELAIMKGHGDIKGETNDVIAVDFSNDGSRIVTGSGDGTARVWDAWSGRELTKFNKHKSPVWSVEYSSDSRLVVTGSGGSYGTNASVRVWQADTGEESVAVSTPRLVSEARFNQDGSHVVAIADDGRIWLINIAAASIVAVFGDENDRGYVHAYFTTNGDRVVGIGPSSVKIWRYFRTTQGVMDHIKETVPRCLLADELESAFLGPEPATWCVERAKWPYGSEDWKAWLADKRRGGRQLLRGRSFSQTKEKSR